jgi:hypothetical protein
MFVEAELNEFKGVHELFMLEDILDYILKILVD